MFKQTPNPPLEILLPQLREAFVRKSLSDAASDTFVEAIKTRAKQPVLKNDEQYREAWVAAQAAMGVLTCDQDDSEAAVWLRDISHAIFDYEDAFEEQHGYRPLHPGPAEWTDGPTGNA